MAPCDDDVLGNEPSDKYVCTGVSYIEEIEASEDNTPVSLTCPWLEKGAGLLALISCAPLSLLAAELAEPRVDEPSSW